MVGVVGSSPIAPTNILLHIKHLVVTLGAFLLGPFNWGQININFALIGFHRACLLLGFGSSSNLLICTTLNLKNMINWNTCPSVEKHPERLRGAWVFRGTRVPLVALFENIEDGISVNDFVELFPGVQLEQVKNVLEHAGKNVSSAH